MSAFIHFKKPIVVAINGPALGLGASILPLCDVVWASERAWFQTPCAALHITPSGCSSYTFPQILGVALVGTVNIETLIFLDFIIIVVASTYLTPSRLRDTLEILLDASILLAGKRDVVLWKKTHSAGSLQSRSGLAGLLANHV